jgi:excisionase family DNA binding protein
MSTPTRRPDEAPLTLHEAAEVLGLHYMTVYRYVRTGQLAATRDGGQWRVSRDDVEALRSRPRAVTGRRPAGSATSERGRTPNAGRVERLADRLVAGDAVGSWTIVERALAAGAEPGEVHLDLLGPALALIGDRWASGRWSIAQEHRATAEALRVVGRMGPLFRRPGPKAGTVVIGAAPGDPHSLPVALAADLLREARLDVIDLGANTPGAAFVEAARSAHTLVAVCLCVTTEVEGEAAEALAHDVHLVTQALDVPLLIGGRGVPSQEAALGLGGSAWSRSAPDLVGWCRARARSTATSAVGTRT